MGRERKTMGRGLVSGIPINLKYMVENETFIACLLLTADRFIKYCKEWGVKTSRKQLEHFEER